MSQPDQPDPWVRVRRSHLNHMHEAATADHSEQEAHEQQWGYWAGHGDGRDEGRSEAFGEVARGVRDDKRAQQQVFRDLREESARWADRDGNPGTRAGFGRPRPGDYQGGPIRPEREPEREAG
jgi:hypothetical protein